MYVLAHIESNTAINACASIPMDTSFAFHAINLQPQPGSLSSIVYNGLFVSETKSHLSPFFLILFSCPIIDSIFLWRFLMNFILLLILPRCMTIKRFIILFRKKHINADNHLSSRLTCFDLRYMCFKTPCIRSKCMFVFIPECIL